MEASEAPLRIILSADRDTQIINDEWVVNDYTDNIKIEYIRTDFVLEWIKNKVDKYIVDTPMCSYFDHKRAIEDFKTNNVKH